jgi:hypothetical protein
MRMKLTHHQARAESAYTLAEVVIASAIVAVMAVSLYLGISSGFGMVNMSRQNLRATQIALEKMETMRMYSWDQVNSNGFVPETFTAPFFPAVTGAPGSDGGLTYYGKTEITGADLPSAYSNDVRMVVVTITWTNRNIAQKREMRTLISQYGMQRYIY